MDATQGAALVASSAVSGASYTFQGPRGIRVVVTSTDARTAVGGPLGPVDNLVGLSYEVEYGLPPACDATA